MYSVILYTVIGLVFIIYFSKTYPLEIQIICVISISNFYQNVTGMIQKIIYVLMLLLSKLCVFFNNDFKVIWRTPSNSWNIALAYGSEKNHFWYELFDYRWKPTLNLFWWLLCEWPYYVFDYNTVKISCVRQLFHPHIYGTKSLCKERNLREIDSARFM